MRSLFDLARASVLVDVAAWLDAEISRDRSNWEVVATSDGRYVFVACRDASGLAGAAEIERTLAVAGRNHWGAVFLAIDMRSEHRDRVVLGRVAAPTNGTTGRAVRSDGPIPADAAGVVTFASTAFSRANRAFLRTGAPTFPRLRERARRLRALGGFAASMGGLYAVPVLGQIFLAADALALLMEVVVLPINIVWLHRYGEAWFHPASASSAVRAARNLRRSDPEWRDRVTKSVADVGMDGLRPWMVV